MTQNKGESKTVTAVITASGKSKEVKITPKTSPEDVLNLLAKDPRQYNLRSGTNTGFEKGSDLYQQVEPGSVLYAHSGVVPGVRG